MCTFEQRAGSWALTLPGKLWRQMKKTALPVRQEPTGQKLGIFAHMAFQQGHNGLVVMNSLVFPPAPHHARALPSAFRLPPSAREGDGTLVVLVNGQPVCKGPKQAPVLDVPLYPVVDLLGAWDCKMRQVCGKDLVTSVVVKVALQDGVCNN